VVSFNPDDWPNTPGAYALLLRLPHTIEVPIDSLARPRLASGDYIYVGSARGPGGLRARLARHARKNKKHHWHVDHLSRHLADVFALPGGRECDLLQALLTTGRASVPIQHFGASDCKRCPAHLVKLDAPHGWVDACTTLARVTLDLPE